MNIKIRKNNRNKQTILTSLNIFWHLHGLGLTWELKWSCKYLLRLITSLTLFIIIEGNIAYVLFSYLGKTYRNFEQMGKATFIFTTLLILEWILRFLLHIKREKLNQLFNY